MFNRPAATLICLATASNFRSPGPSDAEPAEPLSALRRLLDMVGSTPRPGCRARDWSRRSVTLLVAGLLFTANASAAEPQLSPQTSSVSIPCGLSPFGRYVTVGQNREFVLTQIGASSTSDFVRSYQPNFAQVNAGTIRSNPAFGATTAFLKGTAADLNGDGRDEVIQVARKSDNTVLVAVYQPNGTSFDLIDTWTTAGALITESSTNSRQVGAQIIAGDFDGSRDGHEELAVLTRPTGTPTSVRVHLLSGNANGGIAQADNTALATWNYVGNASNIISTNLSLAAADLLLTGRDQLVVATEINGHLNTRVLRYHLLELEGNGYDSFLTVQAGHTAWASTSFDDAIGSVITGFTINTSGIRGLEIDAGDVIDSAQAELVLHLQAEGASNLNIIAQRLYRFRTPRDANNGITGIIFETLDTQRAQDASDPVEWEAAIGNIDSVSPAEIIIARAVPGNSEFRVEAYKSERYDDGAPNPPFGLRIRDTPSYDASYFSATAPASDMRRVQVAIGDVNADGVTEVLTVHQEPDGSNFGRLVLARYALDPNSLDPITFSGTQQLLSLSSDNTRLELAAADIDGDSVFGSIGTDCRRVTEPQVRSVVWWPPYFDALQGGNGNFLATFGKTRSLQATEETSFGTFTSHSVSGYLGASVTVEVSGIGASGSIKATAGASYQASRGEIFGSETTTERSESLAQSLGEGLVVVEENVFDCYQFNVDRQNDALPAGNLGVLRMCEVIDGTKIVAGTDADNWDTQYANQSGGGPPAQWVPIQHEWASLSLFRPVSSNASFVAGSQSQFATDGLFDTVASTQNRAQPYLQIDLGEVVSLSNVRIFPPAGSAASLAGFRLYTSTTVMQGDAVPSGPGVGVFATGLASEFGYDRWNIHLRDSQNGTLPVRYLRLQHPSGNVPITISEIQAFGDVHVEPHRYPQAVCDAAANDQRHRVRVWDGAQFRNIDQHGDLLWNGTPTDSACGTTHSGVPSEEIWQTNAVGDSAVSSWDLSESTANYIGTNTSIEGTVSVGAEFDVSGGFVAQVEAGGGYEFSFGATQETQSVAYWGSGLVIGGAAAGFNNPALVTSCRYRPQPYAVKLETRANTGYHHNIYLVDYVVREQLPFWSRAAVPDACLGIVRADAVFASSFE